MSKINNPAPVIGITFVIDAVNPADNHSRESRVAPIDAIVIPGTPREPN